jgi:serine/threonine protein kinase
VISAFRHLQDRQILHRDLKPENLLLTSDDQIKLADFGWSIQLPGNAHLRQTFCGTLDYISPEMAQGEFYGIHTDNWSIGILCFELLTGNLPFVRGNVFDVIGNGNFGEIAYPDSVSQEAKDFISRLLTQDPLKRMSLSDALAHPFILNHVKKP